MDFKLEGLKAFNTDFMMIAAEEIGTNPDFIKMLRRAANIYSRPSRYDGLQRYNPALGFIFVDAGSAGNILGLMEKNYHMLSKFMQEVQKENPSKFVREDNSKIVLPFESRVYGSYNLILNITQYTYGDDGGFEPVDPMTLAVPDGLERLVNFEFESRR